MNELLTFLSLDLSSDLSMFSTRLDYCADHANVASPSGLVGWLKRHPCQAGLLKVWVRNRLVQHPGRSATGFDCGTALASLRWIMRNYPAQETAEACSLRTVFGLSTFYPPLF
jgi:hypothetical protein